MNRWLLGSLFCFCLLFPHRLLALSPRSDDCNRYMTFCWYGPYADGSDDVEVKGTIWQPDDPTEKPIKEVLEIRCVKRLRICILARNEPGILAGTSYTNIDLFNVSSWSNSEIRAVMEETRPDCEQDELQINRPEQSAVLISSPGSSGAEKTCTNWMGQPKTIMYRLHYPEFEPKNERH
jgi:hypothetical protein